MPASYCAGEQFAHELVVGLSELGLDRHSDAAGNLDLTLPGEEPGRTAILMGSHLDSVPEGGNDDGAAGVVAGMPLLAPIDRLAEAGEACGTCQSGSRRASGSWTARVANDPQCRDRAV